MTEEEKRVKKLKVQSKQRKESVVSTTGGSSSENDAANSDYLDLGDQRPLFDDPTGMYDPNTSFQPFWSWFNTVVDDVYSEPVSLDTQQNVTLNPINNSNNNNPVTLKPQSPFEKVAEAEFAVTPLRQNYEQKTPGQRPLNELEHNHIKELLEAASVLKQSPSEGASCLRKPTLADIVKMTDSAIRKVITICKKVNGFRRLCEEDQIALLKGGCASLIILHLVQAYNLNTDCWTDGRDGCLLKMDVLKQARSNVYDVLRTFIESFDAKWRKDESLMLILAAVALFSPERLNVVHHNSVK